MVDPDELAHRFAYHPPPDADTIAAHETVRREAGDFAALLNELLPDGREKALAFTALEEVMMWSNAAIARYVPEPDRLPLNHPRRGATGGGNNG